MCIFTSTKKRDAKRPASVHSLSIIAAGKPGKIGMIFVVSAV